MLYKLNGLLNGLSAASCGELTPKRLESAFPVFALRYIVHPDAARFAAGRIEVALLAQITSRDASRLEAASIALFHEVAALFGGSLPDHIWQAVGDTTAFETLWQPFAVDSLHVAEIRCRESTLCLPPPASRPILGRQAMGQRAAGVEAAVSRHMSTHVAEEKPSNAGCPCAGAIRACGTG